MKGQGLIRSGKECRMVQMPLATVYAERLRTVDLRVTRPRIAVLHAVHTSPHSDAETVIRAVRDCLPDVSRQTVYDILHALTSAGLLRRIQPAGSAARYESRVGDNHHHVVCRACGSIADLDCAVGAAPCLTASQTNGFRLDEAEVIFWGRCPDCSAANAQQVAGQGELPKPLPRPTPSPTRAAPATNGHPVSMPAPSRAQWLAPLLLQPNGLMVSAESGTGGSVADAVQIRIDMSGATVTGNGHRNEMVIQTWDAESISPR